MSPLAPAAADRVLLERILMQSGVERRPAAPSLVEYLDALQEAFAAWLSRHAGPLGLLLESTLARALLWLVVAAAFALLAFRLLRWLGGRAAPARPLALDPAPGERAPERDRAAWRGEVEARLLRGDVAAAIEALWWWLARSLCGPSADASWTSRELLARAGRGDLRPLTHALDRMAYGQHAPTAGDVRGLVARLEEAVG